MGHADAGYVRLAWCLVPNSTVYPLYSLTHCTLSLWL